MIFNSEKLNKKFSREIKSLAALTEAKDALSQSELQGIKQKVLRSILNPGKAAGYSWKEKSYKLAYYAAAIVAGFSLIAGTAFASNSSIPGDLLYPVKIAQEKVQLSLATSDEAKVNLEAKFAQRRLDELQKLSAKVMPPEKPGNAINLTVNNIPPVSTTSTTTITSVLPAVGSSSSANIGNPNNSFTASGLNPKDEQLQQQAKHEAALEVSNALINLKRIHNQLQAKGKNKDAASVQASIFSLQARADADHLEGNGDGGNSLNQGNGRQQGTSTTQTRLTATTTNSHIPIRLKQGYNKH